MWISRKKYNEMVRELNSLRAYAEIFDEFLNNTFEEAEKELETKESNDVEILNQILLSDNETRTKVCDEIGVSPKTLRNVLDGKPIKPSTREKIRKYIYNANGSIKNEILSKIGLPISEEK